MAGEKSIRRAIKSLPHLVDYAIRGDTITYTELAERVGDDLSPHYGMNHVLGYIRDEICGARSLPYLTAIVVDKNRGLPGDAFLPDRIISDVLERRKIALIEQANVFNHQHWDDLLRELGLQPVHSSPVDIKNAIHVHLDALEQYGEGGEGDEHRLLKEYIAIHPNMLGLPDHLRGEVEHRFESGDRCDVIFDLGAQGMAVVEIKNGELGELGKGVYQAIKYRALMEAERGQGQPFPVSAFLVAYEMPGAIEELAAKFDIACTHIAREEVK